MLCTHGHDSHKPLGNMEYVHTGFYWIGFSDDKIIKKMTDSAVCNWSYYLKQGFCFHEARLVPVSTEKLYFSQLCQFVE